MDTGVLFRLDAQAAIVAGASSLLGGALARGLVSSGCAVMLADRPGPALGDLVDGLERAGGRACASALDPRRPDKADDLVGGALDAFGRLDGVVLAAGPDGAGCGEDAARVALALQVSVTARAALAGAAARAMIPAGSGGWMVIVDDSGDDLAARAGAGALAQLTRELARQWAPHGIRVNALRVAPGWRGPEDVDGPLVFLASPASQFVTGVTLTVDGGGAGREKTSQPGSTVRAAMPTSEAE